MIKRDEEFLVLATVADGPVVDPVWDGIRWIVLHRGCIVTTEHIHPSWVEILP